MGRLETCGSPSANAFVLMRTRHLGLDALLMPRQGLPCGQNFPEFQAEKFRNPQPSTCLRYFCLITSARPMLLERLSRTVARG